MKKNDEKIKSSKVGPKGAELNLPTYNDEEQALITKALEREKNVSPKLENITDGKSGNVCVSIKEESAALDHAKLVRAFGTPDELLIGFFANQLLPTFNSNTKNLEKANQAISMLYGIEPENELEGMLGLQMVATHNMAMELLGRAAKDEYMDAVNKNINMATKLLRTFTAQMDILNRIRGGSPSQKIVVEHVHVNEGGQAIVGNVERGPGGGGK